MPKKPARATHARLRQKSSRSAGRPKSNSRKKPSTKKTANNKPKSKASKLSQKPFTIKSAPIPRKRTISKTLDELDKHSEEIDRKKRDDESWAFTFGNNKSMQLFSDIKLLTEKLRGYKAVQDARGGKEYESLVKAIKIVRWRGTDKQYKKIRDRDTLNNEKEKIRKAKELFETKKENKRLKKRVAKLEKQQRRKKK